MTFTGGSLFPNLPLVPTAGYSHAHTLPLCIIPFDIHLILPWILPVPSWIDCYTRLHAVTFCCWYCWILINTAFGSCCCTIHIAHSPMPIARLLVTPLVLPICWLDLHSCTPLRLLLVAVDWCCPRFIVVGVTQLCPRLLQFTLRFPCIAFVRCSYGYPVVYYPFGCCIYICIAVEGWLNAIPAVVGSQLYCC